jgi:hypothetical protein
MGIPPTEQRFSWGRPTREIWDELSDPNLVPEMPYYQKLALLTQLKAAEANETTARAIGGYTKLLIWLTVVIALGTIGQAVFAALTYIHTPSH